MEAIPLIDPPIQSMTLTDGRILTWQEFGAPGGDPALYFHGGGSGSFEAGIFHREAVERNVRLISTNRPGAGGTTPRPGRAVAAYADDLRELLAALNVDTFACFGESNGGMVSMAVAATMSDRVVGAIPINPTVPWSDPAARRVSPCSVGWAYRLFKFPGLLAGLAVVSQKSILKKRNQNAPRSDLIGPPPGTEPDVGEVQWQIMSRSSKQAIVPELEWAAAPWGFDHYAIPAPLDFFCGAYDAQAPFALVLAERNPNARFHYFSYGHNGFSHPDARRRILDTISGYLKP